MWYMKRKIEGQLDDWVHKSQQPVILQGARRVGKTVLAEHIGATVFSKGFVKIDFQTDLARASSIFDWPTDDVEGLVRRISEYKGQPIERENTLIILDEIQLCEQALNALRFFAETGWRVLATGSLLGVTTKHRTLPFPSGVKQMTLHPMDFEEYLWAFNETRMAEDIMAHAISGEPYILHDRALELYDRYLVLGGMPGVLAAFLETNSFDAAAEVQEEIDRTYTADMTNPENGISGISAQRIWNSLPKQLLRASTKKFKYSEVVRGGRRSRLMEPLEWLDAAGIVTLNDLTCDDTAPLAPYSDEEGSFFKVYVADTGIMFHKFGLSSQTFLDATRRKELNSDFRGALAENYVMQALQANDMKTFYWMPTNEGKNGELDFVFQDDQARIIPVEVKSSRNVKAKTLAAFVEASKPAVAYRLSEKNFSIESIGETQTRQACLPLYAAFCIGRV